MRLRARMLAALTVPVLVVTACGSTTAAESQPSGTSSINDAPAADGDTASDAGDVDGSVDGAAAGSDQGAEGAESTEVADSVDRDQMPQVTGDFGDKPTITEPDNDAPDSLQRVILAEGDGPEAKAGDTVVVNYLGQVWGGEVFDNSYDRGAPFTTQVGGPQRQVVVGWDVGLRGVKAGSRVLLSFPARDGYGAQGSPPNIPGGASLIFVVDVVDVLPVDLGGQADAEPQEIPDGWPTVGGDLGALPTLTIPDTLIEPTLAGTTLVARGSGEPAVAGEVLVQYIASAWDGSHTEQSWPDPTGADPTAGTGPQAFPLSAESPFAALIGAPIGSRVLMRTPADSNTGIPPVAWVIDLIEQKSVSDEG